MFSGLVALEASVDGRVYAALHTEDGDGGIILGIGLHATF
jgi:hypothetical protein